MGVNIFFPFGSIIFFISFKYMFGVGEGWQRGIQWGLIGIAFVAYWRIEPLESAPTYEKSTDIDENIRKYKELLEKRKADKKWWEFWL